MEQFGVRAMHMFIHSFAIVVCGNDKSIVNLFFIEQCRWWLLIISRCVGSAESGYYMNHGTRKTLDNGECLSVCA